MKHFFTLKNKAKILLIATPLLILGGWVVYDGIKTNIIRDNLINNIDTKCTVLYQEADINENGRLEPSEADKIYELLGVDRDKVLVEDYTQDELAYKLFEEERDRLIEEDIIKGLPFKREYNIVRAKVIERLDKAILTYENDLL